MSFIEAIPEDDIKILYERLKIYFEPEPVVETSKKNDSNTNYTVTQVSKIINKNKHTVRSHIRIGLLDAKKIGKSFIITPENLKKYIENEK